MQPQLANPGTEAPPPIQTTDAPLKAGYARTRGGYCNTASIEPPAAGVSSSAALHSAARLGAGGGLWWAGQRHGWLEDVAVLVDVVEQNEPRAGRDAHLLQRAAQQSKHNCRVGGVGYEHMARFARARKQL
jgi:hypothetical protein